MGQARTNQRTGRDGRGRGSDEHRTDERLVPPHHRRPEKGAAMYAQPIPKAQTKAAAGSTGRSAPQRPTLAGRPFGNGTAAQADLLQPRIGNQAMLRHLSRRVRNPAANGLGGQADGRLVQRKCACGSNAGASERCVSCETPGLLQARGEAREAASDVPAVVHEVLHSPGRSLGSGERSFMEARFGQGFGGVRVHTDAKAARSAEAVNSLAYTVGSHIVFGDGRYAPRNPAWPGIAGARADPCRAAGRPAPGGFPANGTDRRSS